MSNLFNLFSVVARGCMKDDYKVRKVGREEINGLTVSTADSDDMGYETAILDENGTHPVERYKTKEESVAEHKKWCEKAKELESITELGYGDLVEDKKITIKRSKQRR